MKLRQFCVIPEPPFLHLSNEVIIYLSLVLNALAVELLLFYLTILYYVFFLKFSVRSCVN